MNYSNQNQILIHATFTTFLWGFIDDFSVLISCDPDLPSNIIV
jgi:hypothetical protein